MKRIIKTTCIALVFLVLLTAEIFAATKKSKKGVLYTGWSVDELVEMGCGNIAVNYSLGQGAAISSSTLEEIHKKGIKITFIVISNIPVNQQTLSSNPAPYNSPVLYMPDLQTQKVSKAFEEMLDSYGKYVDYYVIGNEIGDQTYCYYRPCYVEEFTKKYCAVFSKAYRMIKKKKSSAKVFIPFDQSWDMPALNKNSGRFDANLSQFKYNTKEMLQIIKNELSGIDWGVAAHPYPDPLTSPVFWDDRYAGHNDSAGAKEGDKAMVVTMNNIDVMCNFLASEEMRGSGGPREILISEIGFSDSEGDEMAAAAMTYAWTKIENNNQVLGFIINTGDFPLSGETEEVFRKLGTNKQDEAEDLMQRGIGGVAGSGSTGGSSGSSSGSSTGSSGESSGGSGSSNSGGNVNQATTPPRPESVAGINPNTGANDMLVPYMEGGAWKLAWQQEINEYNALKASGDTYVVSYQTTVDGYGDTVIATVKIKNPENLSATIDMAIPTGEQPVIYYGCYPLLLAEKYVGGEEVKVSGEISSKPQ